MSKRFAFPRQVRFSERRQPAITDGGNPARRYVCSPMKSLLPLMALLVALAPCAGGPASPAPDPGPPAGDGQPSTLPVAGLPPIWLQGDPVKEFAPGTLYLFEFWATWCGPCLQAMPHLEALHQKVKDRKDIRIIGVNVMDATPPEKLPAFLKSRRLNPTYALAADGAKDGPVATRWLRPRGVTGIPHAIAVREGKVVWSGHPTQLDAPMLEALAKPGSGGDQPAPSARERSRTFDPRRQEVRAAAVGDDIEKTRGLLRAIAVDPSVEERLKLEAIGIAFDIKVQQERWEEARSCLEWMVEFLPDSRTALLKAGNMALATEELPAKDADFAIRCADRALAANPEDIAAMELKAAAHAAKGDFAAAAVLQETAVNRSQLHIEIEQLRAKRAAAK